MEFLRQKMRLLVLILVLILFQSCSDDTNKKEEIPLKTTKEITLFKFDKTINSLTNDILCDINELNIDCFVKDDIDLTNLIATFETNGEKVFIDNVEQTSSLTPNNFTNAVQYKVVAEDDSEQNYNVLITKIDKPELFSLIIDNCKPIFDKNKKEYYFSKSITETKNEYIVNFEIPAGYKLLIDNVESITNQPFDFANIKSGDTIEIKVVYDDELFKIYKLNITELPLISLNSI